MLPAQDDTRREESVSTLAGNLGSFAAAKMFSPIAGLREQLQAISLEDIAEADQQIAKLLQHLQTLQRTLEKVEKMRACQIEVEIAKTAGAQILETVELEVARWPAPLEPVGNLSSLISLRAVNKPTAHVQSTQATVMPLKARIVMAPTTAAMETPAEAKAPAQTAVDSSPPSDESLTAGDSLAQAEASAAAVSREHSTAGTPLATEPAPSRANAEEKAASDEPTEATAAAEAPETDNEPVDFDQKLLDDLIKNYGEFVASPNAPATTEPEASAVESEKPRVAMHAVLGGRAGEKEPGSRSQNEIDRQLKKIVKDYGDVDLYAQSSSLKTKLRVGAAFAVLATVLGGIYYFSKPKSGDVPVVDILQQRPSPAAAESMDKPPSSDGTKDAEAENSKAGAEKGGADNQALQKKIEKGGTKR